MIEETAQVIRLEEGFAWVETQRLSACGSCAAQKGCGTSVLAKVMGRKRTSVRALNPVQAQVGDGVIISIQEGALVKGSIVLYGAPLISLILGGMLGEYLASRLLFNSSELLSILLGTLGLVLGLLWARRFGRSIQSDPRYQPVILRHAG